MCKLRSLYYLVMHYVPMFLLPQHSLLTEFFYFLPCLSVLMTQFVHLPLLLLFYPATPNHSSHHSPNFLTSVLSLYLSETTPRTTSIHLTITPGHFPTSSIHKLSPSSARRQAVTAYSLERVCYVLIHCLLSPMLIISVYSSAYIFILNLTWIESVHVKSEQVFGCLSYTSMLNLCCHTQNMEYYSKEKYPIVCNVRAKNDNELN